MQGGASRKSSSLLDDTLEARETGRGGAARPWKLALADLDTSAFPSPVDSLASRVAAVLPAELSAAVGLFMGTLQAQPAGPSLEQAAAASPKA